MDYTLSVVQLLSMCECGITNPGMYTSQQFYYHPNANFPDREWLLF